MLSLKTYSKVCLQLYFIVEKYVKESFGFGFD